MSIDWIPATGNRLLASLPPEELRRLQPELEPVRLAAGDVLQSPGMAQSHVYFPCSGIVSTVYQLADGASVAIALIGREGLIGMSPFLDGAPPTAQAVVQSPGQAFRISAAPIRRELETPGRLQLLALRHTQVLMAQIAQTAVCNRHHTLDQQICRWLLLSLDRLGGTDVHMTQEMIAQMLGVRREGVTAAAGKLQDAGVINYSRGRISLLDRAALEARVCECYAVVRAECARLLPEPSSARPQLHVVGD